MPRTRILHELASLYSDPVKRFSTPGSIVPNVPDVHNPAGVPRLVAIGRAIDAIFESPAACHARRLRVICDGCIRVRPQEVKINVGANGFLPADGGSERDSLPAPLVASREREQ